MAGRIAYYGNISTQGLVLNLDAAIQGSYPKTGSTWFDISNNGNNGTLTNGPLYTGSDYGAIRFDGTNDFVTGSVINTPNQLSVFCFKNPKPKSNFVYAAKWFADTGINNRSWLLANQNSGVDYLVISSDGFYRDTGIKRYEFSSSVSNNIWTQVGFTFNNGTLVPYLNGAPVSYTASLNANITSIHTSSVGYTLGYAKDYSGDSYFSGSIATAQIYNQSLSQFQVWQNFNAYKSRYGIPDIVTDGLVLNLDAGNPYSYLSGSSGTTWTNTVAASSSISGSLVNGTTYSNGAMVFDGVNDYVDCGNSISLQLTSAITVDCWFKAGTVGNFTTAAAKSNGQINGWTVQLRGATNEWRFWVNFGINTLGNGSNNGWYYASYPRNWNDGLWHNFVGIWDGSTKTVKLYIDSNQGTFNAGGAPSGESSNFSNYNGPVVLGRETDAVNFYNGNTANFKIYNRALSATEITQNFNALRGRYGI